jgi:hypothetical protein
LKVEYFSNVENNVEKKRSHYGVPYTAGASMNHIWRPLVEKAGYQMEDIPIKPCFQECRTKLGSHRTRRWREVDSNLSSGSGCRTFGVHLTCSTCFIRCRSGSVLTTG